MGGPRRPELLGAGIAAILRFGTLASMAAVAIGYAWLLASGVEPGTRPLLELIGAGGGGAVVGIGLLGLTLLPAGVLGMAAAGFIGHGERRRAVIALIVLALLVGGLVTAILVTAG
jgi:hypothetical protein